MNMDRNKALATIEVPEAIIKAAEQVELYFKNKGILQWRLGGLASALDQPEPVKTEYKPARESMYSEIVKGLAHEFGCDDLNLITVARARNRSSKAYRDLADLLGLKHVERVVFALGKTDDQSLAVVNYTRYGGHQVQGYSANNLSTVIEQALADMKRGA